jgi:uncharacterized membrane protein YjjP (DUF1212 family)
MPASRNESSGESDALERSPIPAASTETRAEYESAEAQAFVMALGRALLLYGTPANRVEESLLGVSRALGLDAEFSSTPTALTATFLTKPVPRTQMTRADPGDIQLEKLILMNELRDRVTRGTLQPRDATELLGAIVASKSRYSTPLTTIAQAVCAAATACVFGGRTIEIASAGVLGLATAIIGILCSRHPGARHLHDLVAAFVASFAAHAIALEAGPGSVYLITVTAVIVLVPGLSLTVALTELSTRHLVSGTARLVGAGVTFLLLAFGVALGGRLGATLFGPAAPHVPREALLALELPALVLTTLGFTAIFQARPRDAGWILVASALAIIGARTGRAALGPELGACFGAFLAAVAANGYSRAFRRPARVLLMPAIILLVPGSIGFRSVALLLERDVLRSIETGFTMVLSATSLVAGVLVANLVVPNRTAL